MYLILLVHDTIQMIFASGMGCLSRCGETSQIRDVCFYDNSYMCVFAIKN